MRPFRRQLVARQRNLFGWEGEAPVESFGPKARQEPRPPKCDGTRGFRRGAAAAELALVLSFLSLVFVATLDFCRIFHTAQAIENSARTGALYASGIASNPAAGSPEEAAKQAAVTECATLSPPLKSENVTTTWEGSTAVVTVRYDFPLLTPFLDSSGVVKITRTVKMGQAPKGP